MRTISAFSLVVILFIFTSSCHKANTITLQTGTWIFMDSTFHTVSCAIDSNELRAVDTMSISNPNVNSMLTVGFAGVPPTTGGIYSVVSCISGSFQLRPGQVYVILNVPGAYGLPFISTGTGTVAVTVNNGKLNISGSNIMLSFYDLPSDSSKISFNITQLP